MSQPNPPRIDADDPEERREQLKEAAREDKKQYDEEHDTALKQIAQGEGLEQYETVTLGELELAVNRWIPNRLIAQVQQLDALNLDREEADESDVSAFMEQADTVYAILSEMTKDDVYNATFWAKYTDRYGPLGLLKAVNTVLSPALENMEEQGEALGNSQPRGEEPRSP